MMIWQGFRTPAAGAMLLLFLVGSTVVEASRFLGLASQSSLLFGVNEKGFQKNHDLLTSLRGGDSEEGEVLTLDEKVRKAMTKLGLAAPSIPKKKEATAAATTQDCQDGVCPVPDDSATESSTTTAAAAPPPPPPSKTLEQLDMDVETLADKIADDMNVHPSLAMAALGATSTFETANPTSRQYNEALARSMISQELDMMEGVAEDSPEVKELEAEGYDTFLSRRALAFSDGNIEDARAILEADQMDQEEEERDAADAREKQRAAAAAAKEPEMKSVSVDANFDPTATASTPPPPVAASATSGGDSNPPMPKAARKEDVVFEATTAQIQELVIDSPVPVLLDIYADWCGPCKVLGPALEDMAVKAGGIFRLVKINSDNERPVSAALEVTALPTVFGIKDGKIENMFQGMPKSEDHMKNFMMGLLMPGGKFEPPVTAQEAEKFEELSSKLAKTAGAASFSFAARELLQDRISARLDALVEARNGDLVDTEESVQLLRSLLSNIIKTPYEEKFRKVNLANKVIAAKVANFQPCIAILKSVGFVQDGSDAMVIGKGKRVVNVAPLTVARDYLDKWIDTTRYDVAKAARKRKDELALKELEESGALDVEEESEQEEEEVDPDRCDLKIRIEGKKKVHEIAMHADDPLTKVIDSVPMLSGQEEELQLTCVAKRLVVKSTDEAAMKKTLRDWGLVPAAALVVKIGAGANPGGSVSKGSLAERAAAEKKKKKGSHTMQSIGVYAKDDHLKGNMVDGGGGVMYEQDVTDDEEEAPQEQAEDASSSPDEASADESNDTEA